jgi:beta-galactosidase
MKTLLDRGWRFTKGDPPGGVSLLYDVRPQAAAGRGAQPAPVVPLDTPPRVIKPWVLLSGNNLLKDPAKRAKRPEGSLGDGVPYVATTFDDSSWRKVDLPHDYAIEGPFSIAGGGGMGRLPSPGVVWYRRNLNVPASSAGKSLFLDIDGAMSYSEV